MKESEREKVTGRLNTKELMVQPLLSCYLSCSGLLSVCCFLTFKFLSPLDEPKPGNPFVFLPFLSALCDTVMGSSHRAYLCLFLSPSLPSELIRGQWAGKQAAGGRKVGGLANHGGSKVSLQQAGGACSGGNCDSAFSEAHKPDHRGNNGTIMGCAYSCAQRIVR